MNEGIETDRQTVSSVERQRKPSKDLFHQQMQFP